MTPTGSGRDILCVAGGTGLAPIKAILEHVIASGQRPNIHLLYGARHAHELYDLTDLVRMESAFPWLRVLPVVSDQPGYDGHARSGARRDGTVPLLDRPRRLHLRPDRHGQRDRSPSSSGTGCPWPTSTGTSFRASPERCPGVDNSN